MSLSRNPRQYFKTLKAIGEGWNEIEQQALKNAIRDLYKSRMVEEKQNKDDSFTIVLSENGKKKALTFKLDQMEIKKPEEWDKKWRMAIFDIPENRKKVRDAMRYHLKKLEFFEFQKSVFIHPFDCKDEIDYIIEFYNIRKFVRFVIAESIDNELHIKKHFNLV